MANIAGFGAVARGIRSSLQTGKENRRLDAESSRRDDETARKAKQEQRLARQAKRQELVTELNLIDAQIKDPTTPDSVKLDLHNGRRKDILDEISGGKIFTPQLTFWPKGLGKVNAEINKIVNSNATPQVKITNIAAVNKTAVSNDPDINKATQAAIGVQQEIIKEQKKNEFEADVSNVGRLASSNNISTTQQLGQPGLSGVPGQTPQQGPPDEETRLTIRRLMGSQEYAGQVADGVAKQRGDVAQKEALSAAGRKPEATPVDESFATVLEDTGKRLKELKEQGKMPQLVYDQEITAIMELYAIPEERKGEVEEVVNGIISGGGSPDIPVELQEEPVNAKDTTRNWLDVLQMTPLIGGKNVFP